MACARWISACASNCATCPRLRRLRGLHGELGVRRRDQRARLVFARHGLGFLRLYEDALLGFGFFWPFSERRLVLRDVDFLVAHGLGFADGRQRFLLLHVHALIGFGLLLALLGLGEVL